MPLYKPCKQCNVPYDMVAVYNGSLTECTSCHALFNRATDGQPMPTSKRSRPSISSFSSEAVNESKRTPIDTPAVTKPMEYVSTRSTIPCEEKKNTSNLELSEEPPPWPPKISSGAGAGEEKKRCPFCGEWIMQIAIKCKHCQSAIVGQQEANRVITPVDEPKTSDWGHNDLHKYTENGKFLNPPIISGVTRDEKLSAVLSYVLGFFTAFIGPLVIWLSSINGSKYVRFQAAQVALFQVMIFGIGFASGLLMQVETNRDAAIDNVYIAAFMIFCGGILNLVVSFLGAIYASEGRAVIIPLFGDILKPFTPVKH